MNCRYILLSFLAFGAFSATAQIDYSSWMKELPDTAKIRTLSLPGSHDAATSSLSGGAVGGKSQTYTISQQWDKGVRVFDLRPREDMNIYHTLNTNVTMDQVFSTLKEKLENNPDEVAVCLIRFERDEPTEAQLSQWQQKMSELLSTYNDDIVEFSPSLKVGNARGKILVLTRNDFETSKAGLLDNWTYWPTLAEQQDHFVTLSLGRSKIKSYLQDKFEYSNIQEKQTAINGLLSWGSANTNAPIWIINHVSGYIPSIFGVGATTQFETNAKTMNPYMIEKLEGLRGRAGIVMMDFAGDNSYKGQDLIDALINQNFKYLAKDGKTPEVSKPVDIVTPEGYTLVWHDEFEGYSLGEDWVYEVQGSGWVNNELQNYVNYPVDGKNVAELENGYLKINCFKGSDGKIYSGRIYAKPNEGWTYGYFEASINLPSGYGTWPAFWMMPVEFKGWPDSGEMDIMEEVGVVPNEVSSSLHALGHYHVNNTQVTKARILDGAEGSFHKYALEWTPEKITTYVDGEPLLTYENDSSGDINWPYHNPFYLILNLAWGGDWGGMWGVHDEDLPVIMKVDYVRVFQKID